MSWLRKDDCQQAVLFLTGVRVVHWLLHAQLLMETFSCASLRAERVGCETTGPAVPLGSLTSPVPVE